MSCYCCLLLLMFRCLFFFILCLCLSTYLVRSCLIYALHRPVTSPNVCVCLCILGCNIENNRKTRNAAQSFQLQLKRMKLPLFSTQAFFSLYSFGVSCVFFRVETRKAIIISREEEEVLFLQARTTEAPFRRTLCWMNTKALFNIANFSSKSIRGLNTHIIMDGSMRWKEMPFTTFFSNVRFADPRQHNLPFFVFFASLCTSTTTQIIEMYTHRNCAALTSNILTYNNRSTNERLTDRSNEQTIERKKAM